MAPPGPTTLIQSNPQRKVKEEEEEKKREKEEKVG